MVDSVLDQVAQVVRGVADQAHRPLGFHVLGQDEDADRWMSPSECMRGADALVSEGGWHLDVDDDCVRLGQMDLADQAGGVGGGASDLATGVAE